MSYTFNNPIPRTNLPVNYEASPLQSPRESGSVLKDWRRIQYDRDRSQGLTDALAALYRQASRASRPQWAFSNLHPFKVYQYPQHLRVFVPTDAIKRFKVRGGSLTQPFQSVATAISGSDGTVDPNNEAYLTGTTQVPPTDATLISDTWNEFVVPQDGTPYYVWASLCLNTEPITQGLVFGNDPTTGLSLQSGAVINDPWPNFPSNDPYHWMIAGIIGNPSFQYLVEQYINDNIVTDRRNIASGVGINPELTVHFCGEYGAATPYYVGDSVTVTDTHIKYYVYYPSVMTAESLENGPITGVAPTDPATAPWVLVSKSTP